MRASRRGGSPSSRPRSWATNTRVSARYPDSIAGSALRSARCACGTMSATGRPRHPHGAYHVRLEVRDRLAVTPIQYRRVAYVTLASLTLIVLTGAAVRLTDSGLGCANWPKCGGTPLPPLSSHALIEFGNRAVSGVVGVITVAAALLAWTRRPFRRDLLWLALLLPLGVVAQAVLGGFTVLNHLAPGFVMAHFSLSLLILVAAFALAWRATYEPGTRPLSTDRTAVWSVRGLLPLGALTIFAGTAATAAGPHSGGLHGSGGPSAALQGRRHAGLDDSPARDDRRDLRRGGDRGVVPVAAARRLVPGARAADRARRAVGRPGPRRERSVRAEAAERDGLGPRVAWRRSRG